MSLLYYIAGVIVGLALALFAGDAIRIGGVGIGVLLGLSIAGGFAIGIIALVENK